MKSGGNTWTIKNDRFKRLYEIVEPLIGEQRFKFHGQVYKYINDRLTISQKMEISQLHLNSEAWNQLYELFLIK